MAGVVLEGVSRGYPGGVLAVNNLEFEVRDKEFVVLVGPSRCGKSTTLRMIAGLEQVSAGRIWFDGHCVNDLPARDRDVAMVFQHGALYPHLTVHENLALGLRLRSGRGGLRTAWRRWTAAAVRQGGGDGREIDARVRETAELLGLGELLARYPRQLSGGQRQRVALGRAIVRRPAAFLLDEPLSNLDARLRVEMRHLLKQLHQRLQTTTIYVTHDQVEALTLADRIVVMNRGEVQQIGSPAEVYERPSNRFVAEFLGTPPMNCLEGRLVTAADGSLRFETGAWSLPLDGSAAERFARYRGRAVVLGVRAEDVRVGEPGATIAARVELTEMLGDATAVRLDAGRDGKECIVWSKVPAALPIACGDEVAVVLDMRRACVFDPETGTNWSRHDGDESN